MLKGFLRLVGLLLLAVVVVGIGLRLFVVDLVSVSGDDMSPTLGTGAWILVNRHAEPRRGDLVMFRSREGKDLVRRIVALPRETVAVVDGRPIVTAPSVELRAETRELKNVDIAHRPYRILRETLGGPAYSILDDTVRTMPDTPPVATGDAYYVLADNREHGRDSRAFGLVERSRIRGVVWAALTRGQLP